MIFYRLSLFMGFCYILLGGFVAYYKWYVEALDDRIAYALGGLLIAYGVFRIAKSISNIKRMKNEE